MAHRAVPNNSTLPARFEAVLTNVYCPKTGDDERKKFRRNYHKLLEACEDALIEEGREVTVVSNLNACAAAQGAGALRNP